MTDGVSDQQVTNDADAPATPPPSPATPSSAPAPQQVADIQDDADLDLLSVDDADDGDDAGDAEGGETTVKTLGPGEDATEEEISDWRAEHGVPDDPADYTAPTVEGIEWNKEALGPILETIHSHNIPQAAVADALTKYAEHVQAQQAALKQRDAEAAKAVRSELTEAEIASVKTAAKAMPAELRTLLNQARAPDGTRIINNPAVLKMITAVYGVKSGARSPMEMTDTRTSLQAELGEIDASMYADATNLRRPWKGTGMTAGERKEQIISEIGNRPPAANVREEESALLALHARDPDVFQYTPDWRGTKKTGAQRLFEIRSGRT